MVGIVTSNRLGLEQSSAFVLGSRGQLGGATLGRAGDNVLVNAATGNLVISNSDEMLFGVGPDSSITRTHNSLASDPNGNWHAGTTRSIKTLTGTVNTSGSTVTRVDWDGSEVTYSYQTVDGVSAYWTKEGDGAFDKLTWNGTNWIWDDGASLITETYEAIGSGGRILSRADADGNDLTFSYGSNGLVSRVTTENGEYTDFVYSGTKLTQLETHDSTTRTRVRYTYDGSDRLSTVTVDLSRTDGSTSLTSVSDSYSYTTTYTYDGSSSRVATISQTDGSYLSISYDSSSHKVTGYTQTVASGVTRSTSISYDSSTQTTITADGLATILTYDSSGRLTQITYPAAVSGGTAQTTTFTYNSNGDVTEVTNGPNDVLSYEYDARGNRTLERDKAGNTVTRTFGTQNEVLTETHYLTPDPDGSGSGSASDPKTTTYLYDGETHLRFVITPEGRVTEYQYNTAGQQTASFVYAEAFSASGSSTPPAPTASNSSQTVVQNSSSNAMALYLGGGAASSASVTSGPSHGSTSVSGAGITYTPTSGYTGSDSFTYTVTNSGGTSSTATVTITVAAASSGSAPTVSNVSTSVAYGSSANPIVLNIAGGATSIATPSSPSHGSVSISGTTITYTPTSTYSGSDSFTYTATNAAGTSSSATVSITVNAQVVTLPAPTASNSSQTVIQNSSANAIALNLGGGTAASASVTSGPSHGSTSVSGAGVTYTPTSGYTGSDSFTYTVTNASGTSSSAAVSITVAAASSSSEYTSISFSASSSYMSYTGLTATDGMRDGVFNTMSSMHGTNYETNAYIKADLGSSQTVDHITVAPAPSSAPGGWGAYYTNSAYVEYSTDNSSWTSVGQLSGLTDGNYTDYSLGGVTARYVRLRQASNYLAVGDFKVYVASSGSAPTVSNVSTSVAYGSSANPIVLNIAGGATSIASPSGPSHGSVSISGTTITYTPTSTYSGSDSFTYTATNASGTSSSATVSITVNAQVVALPAPTASNSSQTVVQNSSSNAMALYLGGGAASSASVTSGPSHGSTSVSGAGITYTPTSGYTGSDSFTYTVTNSGGTSSTATVTITVAAASSGSAPTVSNVGTSVAYGSSANPIVLNIAGGATSIATPSGPSHGSVSISSTTITYTPTSTYSGSDSFTYTATNAAGTSSSATVSITVNAQLGGGGTVSTSSLTTWTGSLDKTASQRADTHYDARGNIDWTKTYEKTNSDGTGDTTANVGKVNYVYDQTGLLLSRQADTGSSAETFIYDGLRRLVGSTDLGGATTSIAFNDSAGTTVITLATGATQTSTYNLAGELLSVATAATGMTTATTSYVYDARGRLRIVTNPTGVKTWFLYDNVGRKVADIGADGSVVEYKYDANDRLIATVAYKNLISSPASSLESGGAPASVTLASVRPSADSADHWVWNIYDDAGRLVETIDSAGAATILTYDGASHLVSTTAYANLIGSSTVTGYKTTPPTSVVTPTADATNDRRTRYFYDADGLQVGALDALGYLTETIHDSAGRVVETIAYATATSSSLWASGSFSALKSSAGTSSTDIHNWIVYDRQGLVKATIDGEGNVARYAHDARGRVTQVTSGQTFTVSDLLSTRPTIAYLASHTSTSAVLNVTAFTYSNLGQVTQEQRTVSGGTETDIHTDDSQTHQLLTTTTLYGASDARTATQRFDTFGRLVGELSGEGSAALAALGSSPTTTQVDDIYARWGTTYAYDQDDRLISKTTSNGADAAGLTTLYYYDTQGRLRYEINAAKEVTEYRYDVFGQTTDVIVYGTRLSSVSGFTGGLIVFGVTTAVSGIANSSLDSRTQLAYNLTGTLASSTGAEGAVTTFGYNAFRQATSQVDPIASGVTTETTRIYDRRGLLTTETRDATGSGALSIATTLGYDAFGRLVTATDALGRVRSSTYDRAGRTVTTTDALSQTTSFTYDGRDNVLSRTDRTGKTTTFAYTAFNRQATTTTPEGVTVTTVTDGHGQVITLTDGAGRQSAYTYDNDGALTTEVVDPGSGHLALTTTNTYDKAGRLTDTTDSRGVKTSFTYDAASRVLTATVDPGSGHLALATTYAYDAEGQQTSVTDPAGVVTTVAYDRNGRKTSVTVDPGTGTHLALTTTYAYDQRGRTLSVTEGYGSSAAVTTAYAYDDADRLTSTTVDPGTGAHLAITTTYAYDAAGDAVAKTDALGNKTRFVYDAENRLIWTVDALGQVANTTYDNEGRVLATLVYAATVGSSTLSGWGDAITASNVTGAVSTGSGDRITRYVYDGDGRLTYTIDAAGAVTRVVYDASNLASKTVSYSTLYTSSGNPSVATMNSWATSNAGSNDRTSRALYDAAGRQTYAVDPEGYVTETVYTSGGAVWKEIRHAAVYSVTDSTTLSGLASAIGSLLSTARITTYAYDAAGRLTDVTDPIGTVTHLMLNARGQVTDQTLAYGTSDAATTHYVYDAGGRVTSETLGYGTSEATTTTYAYDALGRATSITDARGYTTTRTYDAAGRLLTVTVPLDASTNAVTTNQYDALGSLVKVTDPRGNSGYFYYDKLGRQTLSVDPEGYVTATTYTVGGEVASVTRYLGKATNTWSVSTQPTGQATGSVTTFTRDKLDRITSVTDAESHTESYTLSAFGDRLTVTNKLGGITNNTYDKLGLLIQEVLPVSTISTSGSTTTTSVTNKFEYDARGNRTKTIEAYGLTEERETDFTYDKLDRMTSKVEDTVTVTSTSNFNTTFTAAPTTTWDYDTRGNLIQVTDPAGARTLSYYDHLNRKILEVNALGAITTYVYDANGNVISQKSYATTITVPTAGGTPPTPSGSYRETQFAYDRDNRLIETRIPSVRTGEWNGSSYATSVADIVTSLAYDAAGNVVGQTDARGVTTWNYYDKTGHKIATVDGEKYLSAYTYDGEGNVLTETRYATKLTGTINASSNPATLASGVSGNSADRITTFTYDKNGRRLTEARSGVASYTVGSTGALSTGSTTATITYAYDAIGNITRRTEATGDYIDYTYDNLGRQLTAKTSAFTDYTAASVQRLMESGYDGLGNLTWQRVRAASGASSDDRVTSFTYGATGLVATATDATGFIRAYAYDIVGHVVKESYSRTKSDGSTTVTEAQTYKYDLLGELIYQAAATWSGSAWTAGDVTEMIYNAFGDIASKGINSGAQESFDYDNAGRAWRSNTGDGTPKFYLYDGSGHATLMIASSGADLTGSSYSTLTGALNALTSSNPGAIASAAVTGVTFTINVFDNRGQQTATREPFRELAPNAITPSVWDTANLVRSKTYNAFGEVTSETDARGYTTDFSYNTLGKLVQKQSPTVSVTAENGAISSVRPTETYAYDISGRLGAVTDANSHTSTRLLFSNTGYGKDEEAIAFKEFHADGAVLRTDLDVFGDARKITSELGAVETRDYDKRGRLITATHPTRAAYSAGNPSGSAITLVDHYVYDALGQRTAHWNSQLGSSVKERTDYDTQGRVSATIDYLGYTTSYAYSWNGSLATSGLGTFGGWTKTTTNSSGLTATESQDYFGRIVAKGDYGSHTYTMGFNKAGRLVTQTSSAGQDLTYAYYNTGRAATITDNTYSRVTTYGYDAAGNIVVQRLYGTYVQKTRNSAGTVTHTHSLTGSWQDLAASFDAMGRVTSLSDSGYYATTALSSMANEYDAVGNVRRTVSTYKNLVYSGYYTPSTYTQDYWYKYDSMNRFVTTMGVFTGSRGSGSISRGYTGADIAYDAAGQRVSATTSFEGSGWSGTEMAGGEGIEAYWYDVYTPYTADHIETFDYTADGYVAKVNIAETGWNTTTFTTIAPGTPVLRALSVRDAMGRVTDYTEYKTNGTSVSLSKTATYNAISQVTSDSTSKVESNGDTTYSSTSYDYLADVGGGSYTGAHMGGNVVHSATSSYKVPSGGGYTSLPSTSAVNSFTWWDEARQSGIAYTNGSTTQYTSFYFDANGRVETIYVGEAVARNVQFLNDVDGRVLARQETGSSGTNPIRYYYYLNGHTLGENGNTGYANTTYAQSLGSFGKGSPPPASFDTSYSPILADQANDTGASYAVRSGDTLATIAEAVWGDANLWWMIAGANGLTGEESLIAGQSLRIPNRVANVHHTSETFRPYDPNKIVGDVTPTRLPQPAPARQSHGCGILGVIIAIVVAIVVVAVLHLPVQQFLQTLFTNPVAGVGHLAAHAAAASPFATFGGWAIASAAGSVASQLTGMALGVQDKFSWNAVAFAGLSVGITNGINIPGVFDGLPEGFGLLKAVGQGISDNLVTQGIGLVTGVQDRFDWTGLAVTAVAAGTGKAVGHWLKVNPEASTALEQAHIGRDMLVAGAAALAGGATVSALTGEPFDDVLQRYGANIAAPTLGNQVMRRLGGAGSGAAPGLHGAGSHGGNGFHGGLEMAASGGSVPSEAVWSGDYRGMLRRVDQRDPPPLRSQAREDGDDVVLTVHGADYRISSPQTQEYRVVLAPDGSDAVQYRNRRTGDLVTEKFPLQNFLSKIEPPAPDAGAAAAGPAATPDGPEPGLTIDLSLIGDLIEAAKDIAADFPEQTLNFLKGPGIPEGVRSFADDHPGVITVPLQELRGRVRSTVDFGRNTLNSLAFGVKMMNPGQLGRYLNEAWENPPPLSSYNPAAAWDRYVNRTTAAAQAAYARSGMRGMVGEFVENGAYVDQTVKLYVAAALVPVGRGGLGAAESATPVMRGIAFENAGVAAAQDGAFLSGQSVRRLSVRAFDDAGNLLPGRTVLDLAGNRTTGGLGALEFKLSEGVSLTSRQAEHFPYLARNGGIVVGENGQLLGLPNRAAFGPLDVQRINGPTLPLTWWPE